MAPAVLRGQGRDMTMAESDYIFIVIVLLAYLSNTCLSTKLDTLFSLLCVVRFVCRKSNMSR